MLYSFNILYILLEPE